MVIKSIWHFPDGIDETYYLAEYLFNKTYYIGYVFLSPISPKHNKDYIIVEKLIDNSEFWLEYYFG